MNRRRIKDILLILSANAALLAWAFFIGKSPFDLAYFFVIETAIVGFVAAFMMVWRGQNKALSALMAAVFLAVFLNVVYLFLYMVNTIGIFHLRLVEGAEIGRAALFSQPLEMLVQSYRPGGWIILIVMTVETGYLFIRRHLSINPPHTAAVVGHAFQRMLALFFVDAACIIFVTQLGNVMGVALGVIAVKTVYDLWESSPKFDALNLFGVEKRFW